MRRSEAVIEPA